MSFEEAEICWRGYRKNKSLNSIGKLETIKILVFHLKKKSREICELFTGGKYSQHIFLI